MYGNGVTINLPFLIKVEMRQIEDQYRSKIRYIGQMIFSVIVSLKVDVIGTCLRVVELVPEAKMKPRSHMMVEDLE